MRQPPGRPVFPPRLWPLLVLLGGLLLLPRVGAGQDAAPAAGAGAQTFAGIIDGPPPPVAPAVLSRNAAGRTTVRAERLTTTIQIDGRLDEAVYETVPAMTDFIQQEPVENAPATEKTEVWVFFDRESIYIVGRCWDSQPERMVVNEMRRDGSSIPRNENFAFMLDTFYDRRNGVFFELTPIGGRMDAQVTNERTINNSWNPVWEFATARFDQGWVVETRIPFKSLRYRPGLAQVWGFNVRRKNTWKNEISYLTAIPASIGEAGHFRAVSLAATLVGIEAPSGSKNLEIKPYAVSDVTSDTTATPRLSNELDGDVGVDVKYGVTQNLTIDATYNTDFAQVEADEQQVNLTRFSLFFPEKREFFLENQGTFEFGGAGAGAAPGRSSTGGGFADTPTLFYSRQVGLDEQGREVPIVAGGRLTGRVGKFVLGALNIQSDALPKAGVRGTNFTVMRLKRDVLRKSSIGAIFTGRSVARNGVGSNEVYGVDGTFGFFDNLSITTYWARTDTDGRASEDTSYRAQLDYAGDRYGFQAERLKVGAHFNPEVGFVRHPDMVRSFAQARFSPRPQASKRIRKLYFTGWLDYIENGAGRVDTRSQSGEFSVDFQNGDRFNVGASNIYEFLPIQLRLAPGVIVPVGGYDYASVQAGFNFGAQRKVASGNASIEHGTFYGGHKTTLAVSRGRVSLPPHFSIEPTYSLNRVNLAQGEFTTHLVGSRVNITMTPLMFAGALLQYNSTNNTVSANVRFRWEYQPGSELFVVLNEQRDTLARGLPELTNRALIVKINRLFRF